MPNLILFFATDILANVSGLASEKAAPVPKKVWNVLSGTTNTLISPSVGCANLLNSITPVLVNLLLLLSAVRKTATVYRQ
jgi:hypothetical protein